MSFGFVFVQLAARGIGETEHVTRGPLAWLHT